MLFCAATPEKAAKKAFRHFKKLEEISLVEEADLELCHNPYNFKRADIDYDERSNYDESAAGNYRERGNVRVADLGGDFSD
jgi:hypothetical protein